MRRIALLSSLLLACPGDPVVEPPVPPGVDPTVPSGGEARAGFAPAENAESALFGGIDAEGRVGDPVLYNDLVRFVIQMPREGNGYVNAGGNIIDADIVRPAGQPGRDMIEEVFTSFGLGWLADSEAVSIVADGSDGGPAIVQSTGRAAPWRFIMAATGTDVPLTEDPGVAITTTYELRPGERCVRIHTDMVNDVGFDTRFNPTDGWIASGEDLVAWKADGGMGSAGGDDLAAAGAVGSRGEQAFSFWSPDMPLQPLAIAEIASSAGIVANGWGWRDVAPGETVSLERRFCVGRDPAETEAARYAEMGIATIDVSGTVTSDGAPLPGARVHFQDDERFGPFALTGADGTYSAKLPLGDWTAWVVAAGSNDRVDLPATAGRASPYQHIDVLAGQLDALAGNAEPVPFATGRLTPAGKPAGEGVDFDLPAPATLVVQFRDDSGDAIPGYLDAAWLVPPEHAVPAESRRAVGLEDTESEGLRVWTGDGDVELQVPPGSLTMVGAHSFRHEHRGDAVELVAGQTTTVDLVLDEVLPRDEWLPLDGHLHASPSNDANLGMEDRLIACAAAGVEIPVTTDHDRQADYRPLVAALGLQDRMLNIPGNETSSVLRGHANVYNAAFDRNRPNGGALAWWDDWESTDAMYLAVKEQNPDAFFQVNHGRSSGMFEASQYSPALGTPGQDLLFSWNFDGFELLNSSGSQDFDELREDWFSFLDYGIPKVPTGTSDSHGLSAPCGYGRTDVFLGTTDITEVETGDVIEALSAGHVVVAQGIRLRATMGDALPGDTVTGLLPIHVTVSAPSWGQPESLRIWRNHKIVEEFALTEPEGTVWFDGDIAVDAQEDAWFVVEVVGGPAVGGVGRGARPYAAANAFLYDSNNDGWNGPLE